MLSRVTANRYHQTARSGRNKPCFLILQLGHNIRFSVANLKEALQ